MKLFKGTICILRPSSNMGMIIFDDGGKTDLLKFDSIFEDQDNIAVAFKDDNINKDIIFIESLSYQYYYGFNINDKLMVCNYPKSKGVIKIDKKKQIRTDDKNQYRFKLFKKGNNEYATELEPVPQNERYRCSSGTIAVYEKGKLFGYFFKKDRDSGKTYYVINQISYNQQNFINFAELSEDSLYTTFCRFDLNQYYANEIIKINQNNVNEIINCYKNSPDKIKIKVIDTLIDAKLRLKDFDPAFLKEEKIRILKQSSVTDKKSFIEIQKSRFNLDEFNQIKFMLEGSNLELENYDTELTHTPSTSKWNLELKD